MLLLHEFLDRDIDPIRDVVYQFERQYTEDYFNPHNGDWTADDYTRIIDLTTKPGPLTQSEEGQLYRSITRLNNKPEYLYARLGGTSLLFAYNEVVDQINEINTSNPERIVVAVMLPIPEELDA